MTNVTNVKPWLVKFENGERHTYTLEQLQQKFGDDICCKPGTTVNHQKHGVCIIDENTDTKPQPISPASKDVIRPLAIGQNTHTYWIVDSATTISAIAI